MRRALLLLIAAFSTVARAEELRPLTLDEAVQTARQRNRDLLATREHLEQVRADVMRALSPLLPTFSAQGKYTRNNQEIDVSFTSVGPPDTTTLAGLQTQLNIDLIAAVNNPKVNQDAAALAGFCQNNPSSPDCKPIVIQQLNQLDANASLLLPLIVPWAYPALRAAKLTFDSQSSNADASEAELLQQVAAAFYLAAGNDELTTARRHGVDVAKETLDNAKARLAAGVANRVDVTRAEQALVRAEQALREQEVSTASAYRTLATLTQIRDPFRASAEAMPPDATETVDELVSQGLKLRPELIALDRQLAAAADTILSAKLKWLPTLSAFGLARAFNSSGFAGQNYAWAVGVQADWLIYDAGLRQAQLRQFRSVAAETALRRAQLADRIADDVANLRGTLAVKRTAVESARREVALADETLRLTRVQRDAGTATQLDLLQAQDSLINAEVNVARARFDVGLAAVQLRRAAGQFPPPASK